jgi:hypothetical protein
MSVCHEVDENGHPLVVRNGCHQPREVLTAVAAGAPRVKDQRVDAETTTIVPNVTSFIDCHGLKGASMVVAADAGMLSASNLTALDTRGLSLIVGPRMTKVRGSGVAFPL